MAPRPKRASEPTADVSEQLDQPIEPDAAGPAPDDVDAETVDVLDMFDGELNAELEPMEPMESVGDFLPFMSEGIRQELLTVGKAGDPATGGRFEYDKDSGVLTYTDRSGKATDVETAL